MVKTLENLTKAFVGESQARNRYTMYSKIAKNEGYEQVAEIFLETAENEFYHAKALFKMIQDLKEDDEIEIDTGAPLVLGDTTENLKAAAAGEAFETNEMYPEFAKVAEEENLPLVAARLNAIGAVEAHHQKRYELLTELVETGKYYKRDEEVTWVCRKCGYIYVGTEPPVKCPICEHPASYYEVLVDEY
ncbi:MAG: rubrerythrin family protein [Methanobacteriaceae archaeon]|nr:rubrerythrin family protein [Methanobacteriaceae archaeon]